MVEEIVPGDRAIWQSDRAKTYRCPVCLRPVFSGYEGDESPTIYCDGSGQHRLVWVSDMGDAMFGEIHPGKVS
jgi:hypothetical protein